MSKSKNISQKSIKKIFERDGIKCSYCGIELTHKVLQGETDWRLKNYATVDHIIPLAQGGTNKLSNLTMACRSCNRQKGTKSLREYARYFELHHKVALILRDADQLREVYKDDHVIEVLLKYIEKYPPKVEIPESEAA